MCDEITEAENEKWRVGRREFGIMGAGAAAVAMMPGCASGTGSSEAPTKTAAHTVRITTPDGEADAYFVYPTSGKHPGVIMWPDVAGLRQAYETMGTRLAEAGYAVLVVNQYYRSSPAPIMNSLADWRTDEGQAKLRPMMAEITPVRVASDGGAFVDWLGQQPEVDQARKVGTCGYCMGGPYTFRTAAARPGKVGALGSFHGGGLVTEAEDSPHRLMEKMQAALLIAIAQNDDARQPEAKDVLGTAAEAAGRHAEIEVYPAQHGWCTIDAGVYDQEQAEKAWGRMLDTFSHYL
ncbi:MAG: dienelactone hydrolase family protein [Sphingobium sp.]